MAVVPGRTVCGVGMTSRRTGRVTSMVTVAELLRQGPLTRVAVIVTV